MPAKPRRHRYQESTYYTIGTSALLGIGSVGFIGLSALIYKKYKEKHTEIFNE